MAIQLDERYQVEAYQKTSESLAETKKAGIIMPTGTGKSFIALKLIEDRYKTDNQILYVSTSPKINARIRKLIKENYTEEEAKIILSKIKFTTYHALQRRYKNYKDGMREYNSDTIILDEVHRSGAEEWGKAIDFLQEQNPEANVLGMTATPLRTDGQNMIEKRCGKVTYELKISEAVAMGILKLPIYISARHIFKDDIISLEEKLELVDDEEKRKDLEKKLQHIKRQIENGEGLNRIYKKYLEKDGKYIVFCNPGDNIESIQQQAKQEGVFNEVNENQQYLTIESSKKELENQVALDMFEREEKGILKLLYVKNMLNEGYHNEELTGEIMARPTKSYVLYVQQLGRVLSKDREKSPMVLDLVGNIRYFKEFRLEVQKIIKDGIARGDTKYDEKVLESFKILEEEEKFVKAFQKIEQSIDSYLNRNFNIADIVQEIEKWCKERFKDIPLYNRRFPVRIPKVSTAKNTVNQTEEERESRLGALDYYVRHSEIYVKYTEGRIEELNEDEIHLMERYTKILNEYDYRHIHSMAKNIEAIEEWCIEKNKGKPKYLRRMPVAKEGVLVGKEEEKTEEQIEKRLASAKRVIECSDIYIKYSQRRLEELKSGEIELMERYMRVKEEHDYRYLNIMAQNIIEIEEWCEEKNKGRFIEEYDIPHEKSVKAVKEGEKETEDQRETRLARIFSKIKHSEIYVKFTTGKMDELNEAEIELVERYIAILEKYQKNELELKINEIEEWCKQRFEGKPRYLRRFPKRDDGVKKTANKLEETEEQEESRLGQVIRKIKQYQLKMYLAGDTTRLDYKDIEQLKRFLKLMNEYDVSDLEKRIAKIELWCKENFKDQPSFMYRLPRITIKRNNKNLTFADLDEDTDEYEELKLGQDRAAIRKKYRKYKEGKLRELTKEEIELLKRYDELVNEYDNESLNIMGATLIELEEWCEDNKKFPKSTITINGQRVVAAKDGEEETPEQTERRLGTFKYILAKRGFYLKYLEGKKSELTKAEIEFMERYFKLIEKYRNRVSGQDIGEATFDTSVDNCDRADNVLNRLVSKTNEKGENNKSDG